MTRKTLTDADLTQFTGTEHWYRHGLVRHVLYTDGVKYVADAGGAYWLIDEIALAQELDDRLAAEPFQVWTLAVGENSTAVLICDDGNLHPLAMKQIPTPIFRCGRSGSISSTTRSCCRANTSALQQIADPDSPSPEAVEIRPPSRPLH